MNASSRIASLAAAALLIRRAAAPLILHGAVDVDAWTRASAADEAAWRLFLRVERCALPLQRALKGAVSAAAPTAPFRAALDRVAQREAARVLVIRAHLREAAVVGAALGFDVVVLKGGVAAIGDESVDLVDLDLLIPPRDAPAFSAAMAKRGWIVTDESSDHVSQSLTSRDMKIEIHHALGLHSPELEQGLWGRSERLDPVAPLRRLGPTDHVRHLVHHVAIHHPNRRTRLRDLSLIAQAARRCSPAELTDALAGDRASYAHRISAATLDAALHSATGDVLREQERQAMTTYVLAAQPRPALLPREVREFVDMWTVSLLQTKWERRQMWAGARINTLGLSTRPYIRAIEQRYPLVGRAWRVSARTAYRAATYLLAQPLAVRARRRVRLALDSPALQRM